MCLLVNAAHTFHASSPKDKRGTSIYPTTPPSNVPIDPKQNKGTNLPVDLNTTFKFALNKSSGTASGKMMWLI
jgi:hypothetical protein|tara:strand:- start:1637 stop:1855 length:219 start_codon:yes stop_codon:yes gene_type:complete